MTFGDGLVQLLNFSRKIYLFGPQQVPWGLIWPLTPKSLLTPDLIPSMASETVSLQSCP